MTTVCPASTVCPTSTGTPTINPGMGELISPEPLLSAPLRWASSRARSDRNDRRLPGLDGLPHFDRHTHDQPWHGRIDLARTAAQRPPPLGQQQGALRSE